MQRNIFHGYPPLLYCSGMWKVRWKREFSTTGSRTKTTVTFSESRESAFLWSQATAARRSESSSTRIREPGSWRIRTSRAWGRSQTRCFPPGKGCVWSRRAITARAVFLRTVGTFILRGSGPASMLSARNSAASISVGMTFGMVHVGGSGDTCTPGEAAGLVACADVAGQAG